LRDDDRLGVDAGEHRDDVRRRCRVDGIHDRGIAGARGSAVAEVVDIVRRPPSRSLRAAVCGDVGGPSSWPRFVDLAAPSNR
jgi:hypothetical protein